MQHSNSRHAKRNTSSKYASHVKAANIEENAPLWTHDCELVFKLRSLESLCSLEGLVQGPERSSVIEL